MINTTNAAAYHTVTSPGLKNNKDVDTTLRSEKIIAAGAKNSNQPPG